ncbi:MAG: helix-turn-helix transcriptional regulator, partial [Clostridia bacterium]|nr:helix-turn-helix transcriptional regulator [Clostridia bacterium]
ISFLPEMKSFLYCELGALKAHKFVMDELICYNLDGIFLECDKNSILSPVLIKNRVFDIICSVARSAEISEKAISKNISDESLKVAIAKQYIDDNLNVFLTCQDVAEQCHFNTKYLNRIFKKETGMTLLTYIHKTKTEEAERLLKNTDFPLEKIGHMLGFANEYYFNSFFKRCNGISPGNFRTIYKTD